MLPTKEGRETLSPKIIYPQSLVGFFCRGISSEVREQRNLPSSISFVGTNPTAEVVKFPPVGALSAVVQTPAWTQIDTRLVGILLTVLRTSVAGVRSQQHTHQNNGR
jgi:hypothetical protein